MKVESAKQREEKTERERERYIESSKLQSAFPFTERKKEKPATTFPSRSSSCKSRKENAEKETERSSERRKNLRRIHVVSSCVASMCY